MSRPTRVVLEVGRVWVFASALDWPGWCRRGKGEHAALDALLDVVDRFRLVAGPGFDPGELHVVDRLPGSAITDFGAPGAVSALDAEPPHVATSARATRLLEACWHHFDGVVARAPAVLAKGPRGGGRDRDAIVDHVREAERTYGRKVGVRVAPRTPWPGQRAEILAGLVAGAPGGVWPARYAFRRIAWHVLDHAWEIEDKAEVSGSTT